MAIISNAVTIADAGAFSVGLGSMTHIKTITLSSAAATVSFVHGSSSVVLDSTYPIYRFDFINCHPAAAYNDFMFNVSIDSGSNYNVAKTSNYFSAINPHAIEYGAGSDSAQETAKINITDNTGSGDTQSLSGSMFVFEPSNTSFVKHFISRVSSYEVSTPIDTFMGGYANTTSAVNAFQFSFRDQNIEAGTIKLYGIKDS
jgi:hypothetical protein